jgi:hypothetical protein
MTDQRETFSRAMLPIPEPAHVGLTTYDAKDPATKFPPISSHYNVKSALPAFVWLLE